MHSPIFFRVASLACTGASGSKVNVMMRPWHGNSFCISGYFVKGNHRSPVDSPSQAKLVKFMKNWTMKGFVIFTCHKFSSRSFGANLLFVFWFSFIFHCFKAGFVPYRGEKLMVNDLTHLRLWVLFMVPIHQCQKTTKHSKAPTKYIILGVFHKINQFHHKKQLNVKPFMRIYISNSNLLCKLISFSCKN